jgi:hypothetical protein
MKYTILNCVFLRTFLIPFYYGSDFLTRYGSGSIGQNSAKSYVPYGSGSGSATLAKSHFYWIWIRRKFDQLPVPVPGTCFLRKCDRFAEQLDSFVRPIHVHQGFSDVPYRKKAFVFFIKLL